jgi:tRNA U34 2-thiouridine synthase MnmA/TrmU
MSIKEKQITLYEVLEVLAREWINRAPGFYIHDNYEDMEGMNAAQETLEMVAKHFGAPTTVVNFVKAYLKTEYLKSFKEYLDNNGEDLENLHFVATPPIKITAKDLAAV